ncbi:MaoC family dehydratase [Gordonia sp. TBRC 11910]|uniref:MaoC family dehydratase n=1 Tax=Gordonia asplenii TaxID=2725283 RepID=A0A848L3I1_9ACTN|nr:MaoC family dehydratase N-terminal domain-containing protein [Gordonia asplenii]NMO03615.1 MaoC family dehydratase [Gordonia asplenii]
MPVIDQSVVGTQQPPLEYKVERGALRLFALAIGAADPVYTDLDAARAAGHRDLLVPPTYLFGLKLTGRSFADEARWLTDLGIDMRNILHGEQSFDYHALAYAGDELRFSPSITGLETKRGGALQFITRTISVVRIGDGERIVDMIETVAVREPAPPRAGEGAVR